VRSIVLSGAYAVHTDGSGQLANAGVDRAIGLVCDRTAKCTAATVRSDISHLSASLRAHPTSFALTWQKAEYQVVLDERQWAGTVSNFYSGDKTAQAPAIHRPPRPKGLPSSSTSSSTHTDDDCRFPARAATTMFVAESAVGRGDLDVAEGTGLAHRAVRDGSSAGRRRASSTTERAPPRHRGDLGGKVYAGGARAAGRSHPQA
jgi:hypothetical protein